MLALINFLQKEKLKKKKFSNKNMEASLKKIKKTKDFEEKMMDKYPNLFPKDENGNATYSSCGVSCPKHWEKIIDNLCGCIDNYCTSHSSYERTKNKKFLFFNWLDKKLWIPIYNKIYSILDPYRWSVPKDHNGIRIISQEKREIAEKTIRYKLRQKLPRYVFLYKDSLYVKGEPVCVTIAQVKSKFGGLRFYIDGGNETVYGMIQFAEYLCYLENEKQKKKIKK